MEYPAFGNTVPLTTNSFFMIKYLYFLTIVLVTLSCADPAKWRKSQRLAAIGASDRADSIDIEMDRSSNEAKQSSTDTTVVKVYMDEDSHLIANGKNISLVELDTLLRRVQSKTVIVYYSRYIAQAYEGPPASLKVLDLIVKYRLPLRFYMDSTFKEVAPLN